MKRQYIPYIINDLDKKIILISGPRQSGKTTLSQMLSKGWDYLNYDESEDRSLLMKKAWDRSKKYIILDELHKMPEWKRWLKGIYDKEGIPPGLLVTGSAKLDAYQKMGDSLAGRYFRFRLHPFDIKELALFNPKETPRDIASKLLEVGGFPEPYLKGSKSFYNRWRSTHLSIILRQDILDLEQVRNIKSIETLIELLRDRVGSPISYTSLTEDLHCSDKTIKHWLTILENMYVIFKITPFHKNVARSKVKGPKYYFYDTAQVRGDLGAKLENLTACSLLKECHFRQDCLGELWDLHYLAKRGGKEIDFLLTNDNQPFHMIEVKTSETNPSKNFDLFFTESNIKKSQLVFDIKRESTYPNGLEVRDLSKWLAKLKDYSS